MVLLELLDGVETIAADVADRDLGGFGIFVRDLHQFLATLFRSGLRTGRAAASMLEPVQVDAYGTHMPLNQLATISVPEPRLLSVQVWDKSMVKAVEKAIVDSNLGLSPATEGQVLRLRIPELNEERRKELVKVAHKYAEAAKVAVRHVRRDGLDTIKKLEKNHEISEDDQERLAADVQKATDGTISEIDQLLAVKEKEILTV